METSSSSSCPKRRALAPLDLKNSDRLYLGETPEAALARTPSDPDFAAQMEAARECMSQFRSALRHLAK